MTSSDQNIFFDNLDPDGSNDTSFVKFRHTVSAIASFYIQTFTINKITNIIMFTLHKSRVQIHNHLSSYEVHYREMEMEG